MSRVRYIALVDWIGKRAEVAIDPAAIAFRAEPRASGSCRGCLFDQQWSTVCTKAQDEAARRGVADCNAGYVYRIKIVKRDPRQLTLLEAP